MIRIYFWSTEISFDWEIDKNDALSDMSRKIACIKGIIINIYYPKATQYINMCVRVCVRAHWRVF